MPRVTHLSKFMRLRHIPAETMDGDQYDSGDSMPKCEETQPCMEGMSSRPLSPRSWGLTHFKGLLRRPLRRTSPPRSSPPCDWLRPASPCDLPELESHTIDQSHF